MGSRIGALIRFAGAICALVMAHASAGLAEAGQSGGSATGAPHAPLRLDVLIGVWHPGPDLRLAATDLDIPGTDIDLRRDLAMASRWLVNVDARARVARRHTIRFEYLPVVTEGRAALPRDVTYLGERFGAGDEATSTLDWRLYRFGYAYDIATRSRMRASVSVEARHSDLRLGLSTSRVERLGRSRIPMPVVGGTVRYAVTPRVAVTGEAVAFAVPDNDERTFGGRFVDAALNSVVDVTPYLAVQIGVRTIDIRHLGKRNAGQGRLTGLLLGARIGY